MVRKLIITKNKEQLLTSVLEEGHIIELHCSLIEGGADTCALGNIYVGKVKSIVPNIKAAFIEVKPGLECYYDLAQNTNPIFTQKMGAKPLCAGDELLVQIQKEAVKTKQPTVTSNLELPGTYVVLTHGDNRVGISGKISGKRKKELQLWGQSYQNDAFGLIVRTNATDCKADVLDEEMNRLIAQYHSLVASAQTRTCYSCLSEAPKSYLTDLRNMYRQDLMEILVEEEELYVEVKAFLEKEWPEDVHKLIRYNDPSFPLHKLYRIEKSVEDALKERIWLKSGAYLIIQYTEAMTVMDVNTGKSSSKKKSEETYLKTNLEAAREAAKQIRLRNLSGIILIDFINLASETDMERLLEEFRKLLRQDPVPATLVDVTKLQLVEVTRKKIRRPFHESYFI